MTREIAPDVTLTVDGQPLALRLDMAALYDFEEETGTTVGDLLQPVVRVLADEDLGVFSRTDVPAEEKSAAGLGMFERVLDSGALDARRLLTLVWAMAGGPDTGQTPREFGRLVSWGNRAALLRAFGAALRAGLPEAEDGAQPEAADPADPTPRPES